MPLRPMLRATAAGFALAALLGLAAWRASSPEPSPPGRSLSAAAPVGLRGKPPAQEPELPTEAWRQIGPGEPVFGHGGGDCTGCHRPIQTAEDQSLTPQDCEAWLERGCPDAPHQPQGCAGANAFGYRVGWWGGDTHQCRAWVCDGTPGWNWDASWSCFHRAGAGAPTAAPTAAPPAAAPPTGAPATTTGAPTTTTLAPTTTTEAPTTTTEAPTTTMEAPTTTTEAPVPTTEAPLPTTEAPPTTTEAPVTTTQAPPPPPPPSTASPATSTSTSTVMRTSPRNTTTPRPTPPHDYCTEHPGTSYRLDWRAMGKTFFDDWTFQLNDYNNGAVEYLPHGQAVAEGVVQAHDTHAILRTGSRSARPYKRKSAKIQSNRAWTYFLMTVKFSHTPWGCGLWPAFWTHAPGFPWPEGGELDLLEYVNDLPSQTSFHTGTSNRCAMDGGVVNMPFCQPMPDTNGMNYDCTTKYPLKLGCAPNKLPLWSPYEWAHNPGVMAVQWTERFVKVFYIPEKEIPADLEKDDPYPDGWDRWLVSWYPFALSNERWPGTCPNPADVMKPQQLIMNINFCGDWAGKVWPLSGSCVNRVGPHFPLQCRAVDPLLDRRPNVSAEDCCSQFIWDEDGRYGTDQYLAERAYFNISWVKVYSPKE